MPPSHRTPTFSRRHRTLWLRLGRVVFLARLRGARNLRAQPGLRKAKSSVKARALYRPEPGMAAFTRAGGRGGVTATLGAGNGGLPSVRGRTGGAPAAELML